MKNPRIPRLPSRSRWLFILAVLVATVSLLAGCSGSADITSQLQMAPMSGMPEAVQLSPLTVRQAYQFAVANPDAMKNVPCYCGCVSAGHTSNYACYVKEVKPSGEVVIDLHAVGCSICVDITQDVMKMTAAGQSPQAIRAAIDQTYSQYGPPTKTGVQ